MNNIVLKISDFLGYCDLNGLEAFNTERVQELEDYIVACNEAQNNGDSIVADAIYDRLMEILRKVNPDSELCQHIWEDSTEEFDDTDTIIRNNPMYSIQTVKSYECDELMNYVKRLPDGVVFDAHLSVKLNGHGIRNKFKNGKFFNARSRARSSAGRDITKQLKVILYDCGCDEIDDLSGFDLCEVRGELCLPFENLDKAREFNPEIKSAFSGVASMSRDSASEEEWGLLRFVAYEFIAEDMHFQTKQEEYEFLEELGFETPLSWVVEGLSKETLLSELPSIIEDCEAEVVPDKDANGLPVGGYSYYTDGVVFTINDYSLFRSIGDDGSHYKFGNMALKVGYWKQDMYSGYIQTILWTKGKTKLSPVAIVSERIDDIEFEDLGDNLYIMDKKEITNWKDLGVTTASGNRVKRIPLYEPNNMIALDAYRGNVIHFRYGGEAGVVPCFPDGTPLIDGRIKQAFTDDEDFLFDDWED